MRTLARLLALVVLLAVSAVSDAQEPARPPSRLLTASELASLQEGLSLPPGKYTVKVWAPSRQHWTIENRDGALALSQREEGDNLTPRWEVAGTVEVSQDKPLHITFPGIAEIANPSTSTTEAQAKAPQAKPATVPAALALCGDPEFDPSALLSLLRARPETVEPPADARRGTIRTNQQGAGFQAPETLAEWRERAAQLRNQLRVTLGLWPELPRSPLDVKVHGILDRDGYTIENVTIETMPGVLLGGNLYRPKSQTGPRPAILCPHGHYSDGRVSTEVQPRCVQLAKLGYIVFLYDMVGYNDSQPFGHAFFNPRLDRWGFSLGTLQTWNSLRVLDWLSSRPDVDPSRIGCTGASGGGTQTFLLTALDPRVKVAAPVVMVSDGFQGGCVCENSPGMRHGTDNVEIAALAAPRPMKLVGASGDWTAATATTIAPAIRAVYTLFGVRSQFSADIYDFNHNYNQTSRNAVYPFMARWLDFNDNYSALREGEIKLESPEDLRVFSEAHPAPASVKTPAQLETELVNLRSRQLERLAPGESAETWGLARVGLESALKVRLGLINPSADDLQESHPRRLFQPGYIAVHSIIERKSAGESVPVLRLIPPRPNGRVTVVFSSRGKQSLFDAQGRPTAAVQALLDRGHDVLGFDPLLIGESADPLSYRPQRPDTAHYETYNKAIAADRIQDLATVIAWLRSRPDVIQVNLLGQDRFGPLALLARPALEGVGRTAIDLQDFSYGDGSDVPEDLHLPGVLQCGGLNAAAALCSPSPLWIQRAGTLDTAWSSKSYTLAGSPSLIRVDTTRADASALAKWLDSGE